MASANILVKGSTSTVIEVDGGFNVTGPLAQFARTGGVHVAREILAQFAANLSARLPLERPERAETVIMQQPPAILGGFTLLWRMLVKWISGLTKQAPK
jgi:hypothetical protein